MRRPKLPVGQNYIFCTFTCIHVSAIRLPKQGLKVRESQIARGNGQWLQEVMSGDDPIWSQKSKHLVSPLWPRSSTQPQWIYSWLGNAKRLNIWSTSILRNSLNGAHPGSLWTQRELINSDVSWHLQLIRQTGLRWEHWPEHFSLPSCVIHARQPDWIWVRGRAGCPARGRSGTLPMVQVHPAYQLTGGTGSDGSR